MAALKQKVVLAYSGGLDTSVILGKCTTVGKSTVGEICMERKILWLYCMVLTTHPLFLFPVISQFCSLACGEGL